MRTLLYAVLVLVAFVLVLSAFGSAIGIVEVVIWVVLLVAAEVAVVRLSGPKGTR